MTVKSTVGAGAQTIIDRYSADKECKTGEDAYKALGKIPNTDPSEAQWTKGERITFPTEEALKKCCIVRPFGGATLGALAVENTDGVGKLLYISTLKKTVLEYKKDEVTGAIEMVRDENGRPKQYPNPKDYTDVSKAVRKLATLGAVVKEFAGTTIEVSDVIENITTARFEREMVNGVEKPVITGTRVTSIPMFVFVSNKDNKE